MYKDCRPTVCLGTELVDGGDQLLPYVEFLYRDRLVENRISKRNYFVGLLCTFIIRLRHVMTAQVIVDGLSTHFSNIPRHIDGLWFLLVLLQSALFSGANIGGCAQFAHLGLPTLIA